MEAALPPRPVWCGGMIVVLFLGCVATAPGLESGTVPTDTATTDTAGDTTTPTDSDRNTSALRATAAHVSHVADENTTTNHGARSAKSARSSCAGTAREGCVGAATC